MANSPREAVKEQQEVLKEPSKEDSSLNAIRKPPPRRKLPPLPLTSGQPLPKSMRTPSTFEVC